MIQFRPRKIRLLEDEGWKVIRGPEGWRAFHPVGGELVGAVYASEPDELFDGCERRMFMLAEKVRRAADGNYSEAVAQFCERWRAWRKDAG